MCVCVYVCVCVAWLGVQLEDGNVSIFFVHQGFHELSQILCSNKTNKNCAVLEIHKTEIENLFKQVCQIKLSFTNVETLKAISISASKGLS